MNKNIALFIASCLYTCTSLQGMQPQQTKYVDAIINDSHYPVDVTLEGAGLPTEEATERVAPQSHISAKPSPFKLGPTTIVKVSVRRDLPPGPEKEIFLHEWEHYEQTGQLPHQPPIIRNFTWEDFLPHTIIMIDPNNAVDLGPANAR